VATEPRVLPADQRARHLATQRWLLSLTEGLHTTPIPRVTGPTGARTAVVTTHPFRAPHQTISAVGLTGGGHGPLADDSVVFLVELAECSRDVPEVYCQPLEQNVTPIRFRDVRDLTASTPLTMLGRFASTAGVFGPTFHDLWATSSSDKRHIFIWPVFTSSSYLI
jgi:Magnesium chelatase, subunit ChlI